MAWNSFQHNLTAHFKEKDPNRFVVGEILQQSRKQSGELSQFDNNVWPNQDRSSVG